MNNSGLEQKFISLVNGAAALQGEGRLAKAVASYRQALKLVPGHPIVLSNLGNALRRMGKYEEALDFQRRASAIDPRNGWFLANLALAERAAGMPFRATLERLRDESLAELETRMWAAVSLDQPERAFAFRPAQLNVLGYDDLSSLYRSAGLAQHLAHLPSVRGDAPHDTPRPLVYAGCDGVYAARFARELIASALEKCPECDFHLHLMNANSFRPEEALADFPTARLTWSSEDVGAGGKVLFSTRRWLRLAQLQQRISRTVILLDADSIVNHNIIQALPGAFDVALYERPDDTVVHQLINCGFMALAPDGRDFIDFVAAHILHFEVQGQAKWYDDQVAVAAARAWFTRKVPQMRIVPVAPEMMDWTGTHPAHAVIWHAKGKLKS